MTQFELTPRNAGANSALRMHCYSTDLTSYLKSLTFVRRVHVGLVTLVDEYTDGSESYAVKSLQWAHRSSTNTDQFFDEACRLQRLNHPQIVRCVGVGLNGSTPISIMELAGGDLASPLAACWSANERLRLVEEVGGALSYLHENGTVHYDVKPANVLLVQANSRIVAKLNDFGLFRSIDDPQPRTILSPYTAPELGAGGLIAPKFRPRVDIFSLATLASDLLDRQAPQFGTDGLKSGSFEPIELARTLHHGRAADAAERPPSVNALLTALRRCLRD